jgi:hypothetical protein
LCQTDPKDCCCFLCDTCVKSIRNTAAFCAILVSNRSV